MWSNKILQHQKSNMLFSSNPLKQFFLTENNIFAVFLRMWEVSRRDGEGSPRRLSTVPNHTFFSISTDFKGHKKLDIIYILPKKNQGSCIYLYIYIFIYIYIYIYIYHIYYIYNFSKQELFSLALLYRIATPLLYDYL